MNPKPSQHRHTLFIHKEASSPAGPLIDQGRKVCVELGLLACNGGELAQDVGVPPNSLDHARPLDLEQQRNRQAQQRATRCGLAASKPRAQAQSCAAAWREPDFRVMQHHHAPLHKSGRV